jgi:hypothetical protein
MSQAESSENKSMNERFFRSLPHVFLVFGLLAFGVAAFGSGDYAFGPPTGWTKLPSGTDVKWVDPSGKEYLSLHPTTFNGDLTSFVSVTLRKEKAQNPTQHVWTNKNYYICGDHLGRYVIWTASSHYHTLVWEQLFALWAQDGYVVSYRRPQNHPPSNAARASLLSICGVGEIAQPAGGVPVGPQSNPRANASQGNSAETIDAPSPNPQGTISHPYVPVIPDGG